MGSYSVSDPISFCPFHPEWYRKGHHICPLCTHGLGYEMQVTEVDEEAGAVTLEWVTEDTKDPP